jgi:hypothetical protein
MLKMRWYTILELLFVPEFHTSTYQYIYILHPLIFSLFMMINLCITFKKYTGTSKFPFRALRTILKWDLEITSAHWIHLVQEGQLTGSCEHCKSTEVKKVEEFIDHLSY